MLSYHRANMKKIRPYTLSGKLTSTGKYNHPTCSLLLTHPSEVVAIRPFHVASDGHCFNRAEVCTPWSDAEHNSIMANLNSFKREVSRPIFVDIDCRRPRWTINKRVLHEVSGYTCIIQASKMRDRAPLSSVYLSLPPYAPSTPCFRYHLRIATGKKSLYK